MVTKSIIVVLISFVSSLLATRNLIPFLKERGLLDVPNPRSSHAIPTPRGGGAGILIGLLAASLVCWFLRIPSVTADVFLGAALVALTGFIDDRHTELSITARLGFQLIAAGMIVSRSGGLSHLPFPDPLDLPLGFLAAPAALIWIVGVTNLYNFLDGIDGFAGLQGVVAGLGIAFLSNGDVLTSAGLAIAGACGGFLLFNWHPAKVFMGDVGSGTLGFIMAALPFELPAAERGTLIFGIAMCMWFFLSDGVFTVVRRLSHGEKVWVAHRSHLYQRLGSTGLGHDQVTIRIISAAVVLAVVAVVAVRLGTPLSQWIALSIAMGSFIAYYLWTSRRERASAYTRPGSATTISIRESAG